MFWSRFEPIEDFFKRRCEREVLARILAPCLEVRVVYDAKLLAWFLAEVAPTIYEFTHGTTQEEAAINCVLEEFEEVQPPLPLEVWRVETKRLFDYCRGEGITVKEFYQQEEYEIKLYHEINTEGKIKVNVEFGKKVVHPLKNRDFVEVETKEDCPICFETMETGAKLPCGHLFHSSCIHLLRSPLCPLCRAIID